MASTGPANIPHEPITRAANRNTHPTPARARSGLGRTTTTAARKPSRHTRRWVPVARASQAGRINERVAPKRSPELSGLTPVAIDGGTGRAIAMRYAMWPPQSAQARGARRRHRAARSVIAGVLRRDGRSALAPEVRRQTIAAALRWQSSSDVRARGSRVWVCALARGQCLDRRSRAIRVAAAGDPLTKPKKGPKSLVAEKPVTYRPGRLVPKLVSRTGNPSAVSIRSSSPAR
jgi:hypothetical protein